MTVRELLLRNVHYSTVFVCVVGCVCMYEGEVLIEYIFAWLNRKVMSRQWGWKKKRSKLRSQGCLTEYVLKVPFAFLIFDFAFKFLLVPQWNQGRNY